MAVATVRSVSAGLFVPFRGVDRTVSPVGTLAVDAHTTGDLSGGTVTITLQMSRDEFGFHTIWVITRAYALQGSAGVAQDILFTYLSDGNERIQASITEEATSRVTVNGDNFSNAILLSIPIEPDSVSDRNVFLVRFENNGDGDPYELHMFGVLYDAQAMATVKAPGSRIDIFMAGVR